jgi:O-antigen/teichoic acid export membrane protein
MAAAPFVSLCVIPFAFSRVRDAAVDGRRRPAGPHHHRAGSEIEIADAAREGPVHGQLEEAATDLSLRHGTGFAVSVVAIMLSEQTLMNAGVLVVAANTGAGGLTSGLTGFVFNVLLIVRAPLQLFQAIQTSILPHLAGLEARESAEEFHRAIRVTVLAIAAFAGAVALGLLVVGPIVMKIALGDKGFAYHRIGLALVGLGMGFHLAAGTFNQAALARGRAFQAALAWLASAVLFVLFVAFHTIANEVTRVEVGYFIAAFVLCALLTVVYRLGPASARDPHAAAVPGGP